MELGTNGWKPSFSIPMLQKKIEHEVCFTPLCDASKSCKASEKVYIKSLWDVPNLFKNLNLIFSLIEILHESLGTTLLMLITMFLFPGSKASKRFVYWLLHLDLLFICYVSLKIFDQFSFSKVTQRFFVNWQIADALFECVWPFCEIGA